MATYAELYAISRDGTQTALTQKIIVALSIKANIIAKLATPTAAQKTFAINALGEPTKYLDTILNYILAEYSASTPTVITGATDAQVQTAVNAAIDTLLSV